MKRVYVASAVSVLLGVLCASYALAEFTIKWSKDEPYSRGMAGKKVTVTVTADHPCIFAVTSNWKVPGLPKHGGGYRKVDLPVRSIAGGTHDHSFHLSPPPGTTGARLVGYRVSLWEKFIPGTQPLQLVNRLQTYNNGDTSGL